MEPAERTGMLDDCDSAILIADQMAFNRRRARA